ncbi:MAG TPA: LacI family DNA-binding transcriptional regulator [Acidobacteriaceae bacterium]|nr:LacI family DNA-binding transcriptional regulator [Acidobacteriaceae bacterium]
MPMNDSAILDGAFLRTATIGQIARRAQVSTASVSRALNGETGVSEQTAQRIRKIASDLGYYPSSSARTLVTGRSRTFGLLVSDIVNPFFSELLREFEEEAVRQQYEVIVANVNNDPRRVQQSTRRLLERRVDGVAFMTAEQSPLSSELRRRRIPLVFLEGEEPSRHASNISMDALSGIEQAVHHLKDLGHTRIGFLGALMTLAPSQSRMHAFAEAMKSCAIRFSAPLISTNNQPTMEGGFYGMTNLLALPNPPTAILTFNDAMAFGAMRAARRLSVSVPRDISIIGFDDVRMAAFSEPELTTIRLSRSELASFAFNTLLRMSCESAHGESILIRTSLVVRASTGRCKSNSSTVPRAVRKRESAPGHIA